MLLRCAAVLRLWSDSVFPRTMPNDSKPSCVRSASWSTCHAPRAQRRAGRAKCFSALELAKPLLWKRECSPEWLPERRKISFNFYRASSEPDPREENAPLLFVIAALPVAECKSDPESHKPNRRNEEHEYRLAKRALAVFACALRAGVAHGATLGQRGNCPESQYQE